MNPLQILIAEDNPKDFEFLEKLFADWEFPCQIERAQNGLAALEMALKHPHPLVVTEAAAFGLPVVVSDAIGCIGAGDTARPGENALVFPCRAAGELRRALDRLQGDPDLRRRMGEASLRVAETQDAEAAARLLAEATRALHALGPRR